MTTTCSTRNLAFVTEQLGADVAIDYTAGPWEEAAAAGGQRYDLIVDTIGLERASMRLLAPKGRLCGLGASGPGVERVSVLGILAMLLTAGWRTLAGRLGLGPAYTLCACWLVALLSVVRERSARAASVDRPHSLTLSLSSVTPTHTGPAVSCRTARARTRCWSRWLR